MTNPLLSAIENKSAKVGVIGLGYVGLPLISAFVHAGFRTMGFDVDPEKVRKLLAGQSYIKHLPGEWISACIAEGRFQPTADMSRLSEPDALLICVPTPLSDTRDPDLSYVASTVEQDCQGNSAGATGGVGKHDLSRHHTGHRLAHSGDVWVEGGPRLLSGLQPRARGPGQSGLQRERDSESGRRL